MVFAIPREGKVYIGTTDTFYGENPKNPVATPYDVQYIMDAVAYMFPTIHLSMDQVESTWAGVRPLIHEEGKDPSEISRKDEIWESSSGLVTIAGGKLTGYRKMAEMVVDRVAGELTTYSIGKSRTKHLPLSGGDTGGSGSFDSFIEMKADEGAMYGLTRDEAKQLATFYGSNVDYLFDYANILKENKFGLPVSLAARVAYAVQHEMGCTPSDFFVRRTGALYFNIKQVVTYKEQVSQMMKSLLGYTEDQLEAYRIDLEHQIEAATSFRKENG
jgi:glycerol-3-phosphate dehydrogenase